MKRTHNSFWRVLTGFLSTTDEQAMWRVQTQNDHQAFAVLAGRWEGPILDLCARMTGDIHRAEDLTQEAFTRLYQKRSAYRPAAKFSTYLWRIAMNVCYDELRRRARRPETLLDDGLSESSLPHLEVVAPESTPELQAVEREESGIVKAALLELSEAYRSVIILRHYEDLKCREISEILQIPVGTVYSRLAEGYERLARILEPRLKSPKSSRRISPAQCQANERISIL